jgi:hypothetical protein
VPEWLIYTIAFTGFAVGVLVSKSAQAMGVLRAVNRILTRKLFWSTGRVVVLGLGLLVTLIVVGKLTAPKHQRHVPPPAAAPTTVRPETTSASRAPGPTVVAVNSTSPSSVVRTTSRAAVPIAPNPAVLATAKNFTEAWVRWQLSKARWYAGVAPWATVDLRDQLRYTDPHNVPASKVTGHPKVISTADGYTSVLVPTDKGSVALILTEVGSRWLVASV